jgi:hypothetical protein
MQLLSSDNMVTATDANATREQLLLEAMFSVQSVQTLYNKKRHAASWETVLGRQLEEQEVSMRWPPDCENMSRGAEECPVLENVTM